MDFSLSRFEKQLNNMILFRIQLILSFISLCIFSWEMVAWAKELLLIDKDFKLYSWTFIFFHPLDSTLVNYLVLCIIAGFVGLVIYLFRDKAACILDIKIKEKRWLIITALTISLILFFIPFLPRKFISLLITIIPFIILIDLKSLTKTRYQIFFLFFILAIILIEPLLIITRPIYLMNEYPDLYGDTFIKGKYINNENVLNNLSETDIYSIKLFYCLKEKQDQMPNDIDFFMNTEYKFKNLDIIKNFLISKELPLIFLEPNVTTRQAEIYRNLFANLKEVDVEKIKKLYINNVTEYGFQNMSRGQINHIGHILNPINESDLGKPIKKIYMQYGLGNTFILKWTMDLFGGASIQNYYKCYVYYIFYFITFMVMLYFIFKDWVCVTGGFTFLSLAYFSQGYIALILAPGIIPIIHFFDTSVIMFALLFFRHSKPVYLCLAVLCAALGIIINRQFGSMLMLSLLISALLYIIENRQGRYRKLWLLNLAVVAMLSLFVFHLSKGGSSDNTFSYFLLGLFSWPAQPIIISFTILYLVISYLFMFYLKEEKSHFKYIYLFVFIYTQCLFVYYYWSGLSNHLPTVLPFAGLQLMLMLFISDKILFKEKEVLKKSVNAAVNLMPFVLILLILISAFNFYREKMEFYKNFTNHKTYEWNITRAHLITTINPDPIIDSINLIHRFSEREKGIYIISKYDNLIPFLAERYSLMPYFEMTWHLFSDKEVNYAVDRIRTGQPQYIFVDSNIDQEPITDPWAKIYNNDWVKNERLSRIGRYTELKKIFSAVKADYELLEKGNLISVYKRIL